MTIRDTESDIWTYVTNTLCDDENIILVFMFRVANQKRK